MQEKAFEMIVVNYAFNLLNGSFQMTDHLKSIILGG